MYTLWGMQKRQPPSSSKPPSAAVTAHRELIRRNLERFREELGLSQIELARLSGVSLNSLRRYERGETMPQLDALVLLAPALGRDVTDFHLEEPPPPKEHLRPAFVLSVRGDAEVPPDMYERLAATVEDFNRQWILWKTQATTATTPSREGKKPSRR